MSRNETSDAHRSTSVDEIGRIGLPPIRLVALIVGLLLAILATFL